MKVLFNAMYKVVDNACALLHGDLFNIKSDGCLQCCNSPIFTSAMNFKVLDLLENLVRKCVEIELPSVSYSNNHEILIFITYLQTKDLLLHRPRQDFAMYG